MDPRHQWVDGLVVTTDSSGAAHAYNRECLHCGFCYMAEDGKMAPVYRAVAMLLEFNTCAELLVMRTLNE